MRAACCVCAAALFASCAGAPSSSAASASSSAPDVLSLGGELVKDITPLDEGSVERFAGKLESVVST